VFFVPGTQPAIEPSLIFLVDREVQEMKARKEGSFQAAQKEGSAAQLVAGHVIPAVERARTADKADGDGADDGPTGASRDAIAAEAYSLWLARGRRDDSALEDWLEAEARVNAGRSDGDTSQPQ
jgi:hypothetical protein